MRLQGVLKRCVLALALSFASALAFANESPLDVNQATAEQMAEALSGVGAAKAEAIVRYRDEHGPFQSVEQLLEVKGIGPALLARNRDNLTISAK